MAETLSQEIEDNQRFGHRENNNDNRAKHIFASLGSHGANNKRLAQLLAVWDFTMEQLGYNENFSDIVSGYQASIDAQYHKDYKDVATVEELDYRVAKRRTLGKQNINSQPGSI